MTRALQSNLFKAFPGGRGPAAGQVVSSVVSVKVASVVTVVSKNSNVTDVVKANSVVRDDTVVSVIWSVEKVIVVERVVVVVVTNVWLMVAVVETMVVEVLVRVVVIVTVAGMKVVDVTKVGTVTNPVASVKTISVTPSSIVPMAGKTHTVGAVGHVQVMNEQVVKETDVCPKTTPMMQAKRKKSVGKKMNVYTGMVAHGIIGRNKKVGFGFELSPV